MKQIQRGSTLEYHAESEEDIEHLVARFGERARYTAFWVVALPLSNFEYHPNLKNPEVTHEINHKSPAGAESCS